MWKGRSEELERSRRRAETHRMRILQAEGRRERKRGKESQLEKGSSFNKGRGEGRDLLLTHVAVTV